MPTELVDNRGERLTVGDDVAFNLSGQIAKGRIVKMPERFGFTQWGYYRGSPIHVRLLHDAVGMRAGHVSKITNPRNLLVIHEDDC